MGDAMDVPISEVKAKLSKYVDLAVHGERIVILKNNTPLAEIVPHRPATRRVLGLYAGQTEELEKVLDIDWGLEALFHDGAS
jgi:prevent-host-death family protein